MTKTDINKKNTISQIVSWMETAVPQSSISPENRHTQLGVHFEEIGEMLEAFLPAMNTPSGKEQVTFFRDVIAYAEKQLKGSKIQVDLDKLDRVALLDALCDQIVTAVGIAHVFSLDVEGALQEVANSNDTKFDIKGEPIFNQHQKIIKGPNYKSPDLNRFI